MDGQNFYAPPQAQLQPELSGPGYGFAQVALASRGSRLGAVMLNSLIGVIAAAPGIIAALILDPGTMDGADTELIILIMFAFGGVFLCLFVGVNLYYLTKNGQSIGKKIVGIKIVRSDLRTQASIWRIIFLRWLPMYFIQLVPCLGDLVYLGNFLMIFGAEQKCGHDYIADTQVVRANVVADDLDDLAGENSYSDVAW